MNFIVIGQTHKAFSARILYRTDDEHLARTKAHQVLRETKLDVAVYDLDTDLCVLALTDEPT